MMPTDDEDTSAEELLPSTWPPIVDEWDLAVRVREYILEAGEDDLSKKDATDIRRAFQSSQRFADMLEKPAFGRWLASLGATPPVALPQSCRTELQTRCGSWTADDMVQVA